MNEFNTTVDSIAKITRKVDQDVKKNILNYLHSIQSDSLFVQDIRRAFHHYHVFGNRRNGVWYSPSWDGTCYFKSTDGHVNFWDFSLTRLNLHVAIKAAGNKGCIIVDSTRRGKRYPDSLSKTIPIWCAVLNQIVSKYGNKDWPAQNCDLPAWISDSEKDQIDTMLPKLVEKAERIAPTLSELINVLAAPLKPVWICNGDMIVASTDGTIDDAQQSDSPYIPVICVSASESIDPQLRREFHSWVYIQGAGDDQENWAGELTPELFWKHEKSLLKCESSEECRALVTQFATANTTSECKHGPCPPIYWIADLRLGITSTQWLYYQNESLVQQHTGRVNVVGCFYEEQEASLPNLETLSSVQDFTVVKLSENKRKNGKHIWQKSILPVSLAFLAEKHLKERQKCVIICQDGVSNSVAIALAYLVQFYSQLEFTLDPQGCAKICSEPASKDRIRQFASYIQKFHPHASPPRMLLKQLNQFFMSKEFYST